MIRSIGNTIAEIMPPAENNNHKTGSFDFDILTS
jgi:hypothetical protein